MLSVESKLIMLCVVMLSDVMLGVIMQSAIMLSIIMLNVVMLIVIKQNSRLNFVLFYHIHEKKLLLSTNIPVTYC